MVMLCFLTLDTFTGQLRLFGIKLVRAEVRGSVVVYARSTQTSSILKHAVVPFVSVRILAKAHVFDCAD